MSTRDEMAEPVIEIPDWPAERMLELEDVRDEPELGALRHNDQLRGMTLALLCMWFFGSLAVVLGVRYGLAGDLSTLAFLAIVGALFCWLGYRMTRELICFVGGPECHHCRAEDARWRARDEPEGNR